MFNISLYIVTPYFLFVLLSTRAIKAAANSSIMVIGLTPPSHAPGTSHDQSNILSIAKIPKIIAELDTISPPNIKFMLYYTATIHYSIVLCQQ